MSLNVTSYFSLRILLLFLAGILCYIYFSWSPGFLVYVFGILLSAYWILVFSLSKVLKRKYADFLGALAGVVIFIFGILLTELRTARNDKNHIVNLNSEFQYYEAIVTENFQPKKNTIKSTLNITRIQRGRGWEHAKGKVIVYISKNDSTRLEYGDVILVKGMPYEVPPPANPREFNYKRYLSYKNIYFQHYLKEGSFVVKEKYFSENKLLPNFNTESHLLIAYANKARKWSASVLKEYINSPKEFAVAAALVLGIKDELDNELRNAYASAGAMHVLAVSGLHVGIIIHLLIFLLGNLNKSKVGKWVYFISVIAGIWGFAFITGLSASVMRAVVMYTFFVFGKGIKRPTSIYNILALTAIVLLVYQPYMIMEVGFQLSFAAVFGIVYLQPKIYNLLKKEYRFREVEPVNFKRFISKRVDSVLDNAWNITAVSIAAQIATFPIGLLYFHQFPVYFWFSNLFVILLALVIVNGCVLILILSFIPTVSYLLGYLIKSLISFLNFSVLSIQKLPFALIEGIDINVFETWIIYLIITSLAILYIYKKFSYLVVAFGLTSIFIGIQIFENIHQLNQKTLIIYKVNNHSGFNFINGLESTIIGDSAFINDPNKVRFHVSQNLWNKGIDQVNMFSFADLKQENLSFTRNIGEQVLMVWKGHSILNIRKPIKNQHFKLDYLVVSNNSVRNLDEIKDISFKTLILDASNASYIVNRLELQAQSLGLKVYSLKKQGAFVVDL